MWKAGWRQGGRYGLPGFWKSIRQGSPYETCEKMEVRGFGGIYLHVDG